MLHGKRIATFCALAFGSIFALAGSAGCGGEACAEAGCGGNVSTGGTGGTGGSGGSAPETFLCKGETCNVGEDYCDVTTDPVDPDVGTCLPLPADCTAAGTINPDCTCFGTLDEGCACQVDLGNFSVFCEPPK